MPTYEYEHLDETDCLRGKVFEVRQSMDDPPLAICPTCKGMVKKLISRFSISTPKTDGELRDLGFTKLVKRDDGVYENVTQREGESRFMIRDKPETVPDIKRIIRD
ncbi:FmdB family zinc ribbon protein [Desulfonema magnum]|uniref:Regulatory protein, FmdB family n=1 Tax=Desulfonema magnum TaxID=45655 RepID=A0A975GRK9_9BACT|nr:zinc ribbon domain-containing protein [Desulfonema magnum]QTA91035.1 Putative regulatory protein, FmdB family [Desulfonema magnum]